MSYLDIYKARVFARGTSEKERTENSLELDFEANLRRSPDKIFFLYQGRQHEGVLIQPTKSQSEIKITFTLLGRKSEIMPEGAIIQNYDSAFKKNKIWIILNTETKSYYGYIKYKILELNYNLKYINKNGEEKTLPAYIVGSAATKQMRIEEYFKTTFSSLVQLPDKHLSLIMPATHDLNSDTKFIIGDEVWRYIDSDKVSIPGVYYATFYKTQRDVEKDSIDEQIAGIDKKGNTTFVSNYGEGRIITIGENTTNLSFELKKDGRIISSDIELSLNEITPLAILKNGNIIPQSTGKITIKVKDKISNYQEDFILNILPEVKNYCFLVGDDYIPKLESRLFRVNSDLKYTIEYDKTFLKVKQRDGGLEIEGLQMGETELTFISGEQKFTKKIKISSVWM